MKSIVALGLGLLLAAPIAASTVAFAHAASVDVDVRSGRGAAPLHDRYEQRLRMKYLKHQARKAKREEKLQRRLEAKSRAEAGHSHRGESLK